MLGSTQSIDYWLAKLAGKAPPEPKAPTGGSLGATPAERALNLAKRLGEGAVGVADATASIAGNLPAMAVAGAAALPWTVIPGETKAADVFQNVLNLAPKLAPQTEQGQQLLGAMAAPGGVGEMIDKPFRAVGNMAADAAGALGLPAEGQALAGSLGYTGSNLIGPVELAAGAKALPGIVKQAGMESVMGSSASKIWAGRLKPEETKAYAALKQAGKGDDEIFQATGLFQALDGTLRKWLPDADTQVTQTLADAMAANPGSALKGPLSSMIELSPELRARYPELTGLKTVLETDRKPGTAQFRFDGRKKPVDIRASREGADAGGPAFVSDLLHETQHVVDLLDTGKSGTSPKSMPAPDDLAEQAAAIKYAYQIKGGQADETVMSLASDPRVQKYLGWEPDDLISAYGDVQKEISSSKFKRYQGQYYEALARSNEDAFKSGARTPAELAMARPGMATPNDLLDVPRDSLWFPEGKTKRPQAAAAVRGYRGEHGEPGADPFQSRLPSLSFSDDPRVASAYAQEPNVRGDNPVAPRVIPADIDIKRPIIKSDDPFVDLADVARMLGPQKAEYFARKHARAIEGTDNWREIGGGATVAQALDANPQLIEQLYLDAYPLLDDPEFVQAAREAGYDGAIHGGNGTGAGTMEYRVFDPRQARSIFGDEGASKEAAPQTLRPSAFQDVTPEQFNAALASSRDAMVAAGEPRSALQVDAKLPDDFSGRVLMSPDGLAGFAVSDTGYVSNLFKHPSAQYKDVMGAVLQRARAEGGKTLDAFDTGLAAGYIKRGAVETGRSPWNPEYAPAGWDEKTMGTPDYVSMNIGTTPLKVQIPPERAAVSSIPTLYDNNVPALSRRSHTVDTLAKKFSQAARQVWGRRDMTAFTPRNVDDVAQIIAAETEAAMQGTGHAGTWYSDTLDDAHAVVDEMFGAGTMADPRKKTAFNFALAITSNGQLVKGNAGLARQAFEQYLQTGRFPVIGQGKEANSMKIAFRTYNRLADAFGEEAVQKFLNTEYTVGELKAAGFNIADESVELKVPGAAIFGPKIGGGFFANLQGDFSRLTADRWLTRTMSRVIGDIYDSNPTLLKKQLGELRKALEASGQTPPKTDAALKKLAVKLHKAFMKGDETGSYPKSMRNPVNNAARNIAKSLKPAKESPRNGTERNYYRAIAQRAVEKLREQGIETTVSDLQALIWYPEQDLYRKLGYNAKPDQERDYLEAFKTLAREAGVSQEKIDGAIRGARDRRVAARGNGGGSNPPSVRPAHRRAYEGRQDKGQFLQGLAPFAPPTKGLQPLEKRIAKVRSIFSDD